MSDLCSICPRKCGAVRPHGFCRSPKNPVLARAALHRWEEPVISGTRGSGTIFFSGCNLHCVFCQNYAISSENQGFEVTVPRLRKICGELIAQGAHNINFVTPGHYADAVAECLETPLGVPALYNTNGYDRVETLRRLEGKINIYLPDMKYADDTLAAKYSAAPDYFETASAAILEMFRQTGPFRLDSDGMMTSGVIVRHLILPGCVENSLKVLRWAEDTFRPGDIMFSLMRQYVPCGLVSAQTYPELNRKVTDEEYDAVESALFDSPLEDGFVQEEESAGTEFIPAFDGTGILKK